MDELSNIEEMASLFYSFFTSKKASKADFAQQLAYDLEQNFKNRPDELKSKLPEYLVQAIEYVAKG